MYEYETGEVVPSTTGINVAVFWIYSSMAPPLNTRRIARLFFFCYQLYNGKLYYIYYIDYSLKSLSVHAMPYNL